MVEPVNRQEKVSRLKDAYVGYFAHLSAAQSVNPSPGDISSRIRDDEQRADLALRMALAEVFGKP
jgi:hypothetical protein